MKTRHTALLLAASLLTLPALAVAAHHGGEGRGPMAEECHHGQMKGHHGKGQGYHGKRHHDGKAMSPARFEQRLKARMEKLETPELKAQFINTQKARLNMMEQNQQLHRLMAEQRAGNETNEELKTAMLEKIAADSKLKQQKLKLMHDALNTLEN
ncbi:hypothetical protein [Oceanimonas smirnovii]|uniref:hypothetical protein n=1 Tax=Oceanimonas smirnovii TaxID=264574 RepID=UPI00376FA3ED